MAETDFLFDPSLTGTAEQFGGQIGGFDIGAQPTPTVSVTPEFTGTPVQYAPEMTYQTPTEMPTFAAYDPTFAFQPTVQAPAAYTAPQNLFAGPTTQPSITPALQAAYAQAAKPLPDIISQYAGPAGAAPAGGLYAPPTDEVAKQPSALDQLLGKVDLTKLLVGGAGGIMSYLAAQRAQQDAARARQEYEAAAQKAAADVKGLAQPYLTAGGSQLSMALQGALSPAQMQAYQASQAQLAQQAARTGGIGAIQTAAAEQAIYQQALQAQQNMALQLLGPGNQLASNAIMTELQGTQGGLNLELQYGTMASQAMAGMMQSLGYGVGSQGQKAQ